MILIAGLALICAFLSAAVASSKGRDAIAWFAAGLFFGPLGLIAAAGVSAYDGEAAERKWGLQYGSMRKCPECAEVIRSDARKCRFCGSAVELLLSPTARVDTAPRNAPRKAPPQRTFFGGRMTLNEATATVLILLTGLIVSAAIMMTASSPP